MDYTNNKEWSQQFGAENFAGRGGWQTRYDGKNSFVELKVIRNENYETLRIEVVHWYKQCDDDRFKRLSILFVGKGEGGDDHYTVGVWDLYYQSWLILGVGNIFRLKQILDKYNARQCSYNEAIMRLALYA